MTDLLDGTKVPWHAVSGKTESGPVSLPPTVRREPATLPEAGQQLSEAIDVAFRPMKAALVAIADGLAQRLKARR